VECALIAVTGSAGKPTDALLNYLDAVLEAEVRIEMLSIVLDPGLGVLHADLRARDLLPLDVTEPVGPEVGRYILEMLGSHTFGPRVLRDAARCLPSPAALDTSTGRDDA
jgi:CRISPR/Cas system-associated endonuclease Cas1